MKRVYTTAAKLKQVIPRRNGVTLKVYKDGKPYVRTGKQLQADHALFASFAVGSDITFPILFGNIVYGVVSIISPNKKELGRKV